MPQKDYSTQVALLCGSAAITAGPSQRLLFGFGIPLTAHAARRRAPQTGHHVLAISNPPFIPPGSALTVPLERHPSPAEYHRFISKVPNRTLKPSGADLTATIITVSKLFSALQIPVYSPRNCGALP